MLLAPLLLAGCKPRQVVCESRAFFEASEPAQGAGTAPFSIDRLGREVPKGALAEQPTFLAFQDGNHARTGWLSRGHISSYAEIRYSAEEGLARSLKDPSDVFPMKRMADASSERVRLGFRSSICLVPGERPCREYGTEELFLVADMPCARR